MPISPALEIARDCLASRARRLERLLTRIYDDALRPHGLTGSQLGMLVAIQLSGATSAAAIGRRLNLEKSTVSRNLARLAAANLVDTAKGLRITPRGTARNAYQSLAFAIIQATGPGTITVSAASGSLTGASATVQASAGTFVPCSGSCD